MVECVFNTNDVLTTPGFADTWAQSCLISNTELPVSPTKKAADLDNIEKEKMYRAYCGGAAPSPETECKCFKKIINNVEVSVSDQQNKPAVNLDVYAAADDTSATTSDGVNVVKDAESVVWETETCGRNEHAAVLQSHVQNEIGSMQKVPAGSSQCGRVQRENGPLYFPEVLKVRDELIDEYCNDYPDAPDCACANRQRNSMFRAMTSGFAQLGTNYNASCWWQPCQQSQNVLVPMPKSMGAFDRTAGNATCADQLCVNQINVTGGGDLNIQGGANVQLNNKCAKTINVKKKTSEKSNSNSTTNSTSSSNTENITKKVM